MYFSELPSKFKMVICLTVVGIISLFFYQYYSYHLSYNDNKMTPGISKTSSSESEANIIKIRLPFNASTKSVKSRFCDCLRSTTTTNRTEDLSLETQDSLCGDDATDRGLHQKVISFSHFLWPKNSSLSPNSQYFNGIMANINKTQEFYPNWLIRIYTHSHPDFNKNLCDIACTHSDVFLCDIENIPYIGNISEKLDTLMWRFLPLFDSTVDIFISRDLDSAFSTRELVAVNEWLESNKTFHAMRDHPFHSVPLLGGLWGAKTANINITTKSTLMNAMFDHGTSNGLFFQKGYDQSVLANYFYPIIKNDMLSHDSYFCERFHEAVPFPIQRNNSVDFVGNYEMTPNRYPISTECPLACRPTYGKDWKFC